MSSVCVAKIVGVHGLAGVIKLLSFLEINIFDIECFLDKELTKPLKVDSVVGVIRDSLLVKIEGIDTKEDARQLSGIEIFADRNNFPKTDDDEFYYTDLIGLKVIRSVSIVNSDVEQEKEDLIIRDVHDFGAGDILELNSGEMILFSEEFVGEVNLEEGFLVLLQ